MDSTSSARQRPTASARSHDSSQEPLTRPWHLARRFVLPRGECPTQSRGLRARSFRKTGLMLRAKRSALNAAGPCQSPELLASSAPYPRFLTRLRLLSWYRERGGLFAALRRMAIALVPCLRTARPKTASLEVREDEMQNLQPGEWIEVKSRVEILSTLDENAKHRGSASSRRCSISVDDGSGFSSESRKSAWKIRPTSVASRIRFYSR